MELNEIYQQRLDKRRNLEQMGVAVHSRPFPDRIEVGQAKTFFGEGKHVSLAGRIIAKRSHGKAIFLDLRDASARIQLYIRADAIGKDKFQLFDYIDIADIIAIKGELFKTHTGEDTVKVEDVAILAKALRPLPEKWHGLKDVEIRYRQRYLDLIANDEVREIFVMRSRIIRAMRNFLDERGFQEVETPMMHDIPGGAAGRPFRSHLNEYHMDMYLRIAPELYLKRLLVGGMDKVYEINRSFRNEGVSTRHNPEFTMLEAYWAYADYEAMMRLCEEMLRYIAQEVLECTQFSYQGKSVDLTVPWQRRSFAELVKERFLILPEDEPEVMLQKLKEKGFAREQHRLSRTQVAKIIEDLLEEGMSSNPTFVTDYFTSFCPLARTKEGNPLLSERFELYIAGIEVGNAYSELNDPLEQRRRFEEEIKELTADDKKVVDESYVFALEHGMPNAGGLGIGVDRLVMLFTDQSSIRDVILFPLLRPGQGNELVP